MWNRKVFIRIIELLLCIACVIALRITDDESRRVFHYLRNRSLEWSLLNNVTWGTIGAALATVTCGGYIIVTAGLLLAAITGELRGRKTEILLLSTGVVLFGIVGALSLASIDSVPNDLVDNAAVFGALCIITGIVFIIDMLMSPRIGKKKHDGTQTISTKEQAKQYVTTTTMTVNEKEAPKNVSNWRSPTPEMMEKRNSMNDSMIEEDDREHRLERAERQMREYAQNVENGRNGRGKQMRDRDEMPRKMNGYYRNDDVYQRPIDEVDDTPPFPTNETAVFTKVINPGIKIMRVERDDDIRGYNNYRYSDSSQYDNVPTRMRGSSPGILKKQRDVSFVDPHRSRGYRQSTISDNHYHRGTASTSRDEIEMLEECFDVLRTSTTTTSAATQTTNVNAAPSIKNVASTAASIKTPATPTDPGYVRQLASNWPKSVSNKSSGASPERDRDH